MTGQHPNAEQGVIDRSLCFTDKQMCCSMFVSLLVRNCSGFYVYKLNEMPRSLSLDFRVCGNGLEGKLILTQLFALFESIRLESNIYNLMVKTSSAET